VTAKHLWIFITLSILAFGAGLSLTPGAAQEPTPTPSTIGMTPLFSPTPPPAGQIPLSTYIPAIPTQTLTPSLTPTITPSVTPTPTITPSPTLTPTPTPRLVTLTAPSVANLTVYENPPADFTTPDGWSCGNFPCEDDITGFLERIRVPQGYDLSHVGRFPGQPMQITYGPDDRLYATTITDPVTRRGAVYVMETDGTATIYSPEFISPVGLAFQPGSQRLYVSARVTPEEGGGVWRIEPDGTAIPITTDLPCCFQVIDNQPNGLIFGPDGYLYLGIGALTDRAEPDNPRFQQFATLDPLEASILRIQPNTGEITTYAQGLRNPYDLTFDAFGQFYATDNGLLTGPGDRILQVDAGAHYGWPYWRSRGCADCPLPTGNINLQPDLLRLPDYTLPRGIVAYTGEQFPSNVFNNLFVTFWHNTQNAQRVVRIDPATVPTDPEARATYTPEPFITGLIRPVDVAVAPDGSLVVVDFIYGHVWRVSFVGADAQTQDPLPPDNQQPLFVTSTPRPR